MKTRLLILGLACAAALGGLVASHARFLYRAPRDPQFVQFVRRHGRRPAAAARLPPRAVVLDRRGATLAPDLLPPDATFRHTVDAMAVASGGAPVRLTLDAALQTRAAALLDGRRGAVVALEPSTGRLLALASAPAGAPPDRAIDGLYPPGSVFKVFLAAAALTAETDPVFDCPAAGWRPSRGTAPIRDVEARAAARHGRVWRGFGRIGMGEAFIHSSNTYFAQLGAALGPTRFSLAADAARLRDPAVLLAAPGARLTAAGGGVPDGLTAPQLAPVAIGQGALQVSPLTVALFTAAVADDGLMLAPTLHADARPALRARPFSYAAAARVKKMMRAAVRAGTGRACDLPGLDVCGKTGTAETGRGADHAWFTCFAPERAPRLVVTVLVEHGGFGAENALPAAREMLLAAQRAGLFD